MKKAFAVLLAVVSLLSAASAYSEPEASGTDFEKMLLSELWVDIYSYGHNSFNFSEKGIATLRLELNSSGRKGNIFGGPFSLSGDNELTIVLSEDGSIFLAAEAVEKDGYFLFQSKAENNFTGRDIVLCRASEYQDLKTQFDFPPFKSAELFLFGGIPFGTTWETAAEIYGETMGLNFIETSWGYVLQSGEYDLFGWPLDKSDGIYSNGTKFRGLQINFESCPVTRDADGSASAARKDAVQDFFNRVLNYFGTPDYAILYVGQKEYMSFSEDEIPFILEDTMTYLDTVGETDASVCFLFRNVRVLFFIRMPYSDSEGSIDCSMTYDSAVFSKFFPEMDGDPSAEILTEQSTVFPVVHDEKVKHSILP